MALTIVEFLRAVNPNIGLVVNADGSYRIGVEDVNSDEIMAAVVALNAALQGGGVSNAQFAAMVTALQLIDNIVNGTQANIAPPLISTIHKPFGKGALTIDGVQYSAEVAGIGDTYTAIETVTITQPTGYTLVEVEFGLVVAVKSSAAVEGVLWKFQASDAGTLWTDLIAEQTRVASCAAYADMYAGGRFAPTGNFLGTGASFQVAAFLKSAVAAGETVTGKMKSSSYIIAKYRRT